MQIEKSNWVDEDFDKIIIRRIFIVEDMSDMIIAYKDK